MLRLALSTLGARKGSTLGAFAAVGLAVVLVVSCGILLESSLRARPPVERLRSASVVVQAEQALHPSSGEAEDPVPLPERRRLSEAIAARIESVPGVRQVIADRSFHAQVVDHGGRLLMGADGASSVGHGWASAKLTPYALTRGHDPHRPDEVVIDARLASDGSYDPGDTIRIVTSRSPRTFVVAGIAGAGGPVHQAAVFFRDDVATRLSGTGERTDLLGVVPAPGADPGAVADRIRGALDRPGLEVLTGGQRGDAESPDAALGRDDAVAGLTVFALLASFIAIFVVASTFALSVQQRHRELALLRAIGATPRQVRRMVAGEALGISIGAFAAAAPIGVLVAHLEQGLFARAGIIPHGLSLTVGLLPLAAGLGAAVVTTQLAAFASGRRAARIRPTDALRESSVQRRSVSWLRALAGVAVFLAGAAFLVTTVADSGGGGSENAPAATMIWMVGAALLGPILAVPFAWAFGSPMAAVSRGPGMLARANTRANLRRVASVATPLMLAVSLICTLLFAKTALRHETAEQTARRTLAQYVVDGGAADGVPSGAVQAALRIDGVARASGSMETAVLAATGEGNLRSLPAQGVDPAALQGLIDLGFASGSPSDIHGAAVGVSTTTARSFGWQVGDRVKVWLGDGAPTTVRVAATYRRPLGFGELVLPRSLVARHVTAPLDQAVFVTASPGTAERALVARLERLTRAYPGVDVLTRAQYQHGLETAAETQSLGVYVLLGVIGLFCGLALVNALTMATAERAREFAMLRLIGASTRQVTRMMRAETFIMVSFGLTIGSIIAAPALVAFSYGLTGSLAPSIPARAYAGLLAAYALVGFAATVVSTRLALRMNPVGAMAARD